jgi:hypothetical protein
LQYIELRPRTVELAFREQTSQTFPAAAYTDARLSRPMIVEIVELRGPRDTAALIKPDVCQLQRVVFRREAATGTMTPDTATASVYAARDRPWLGTTSPDPFKEGCFAGAVWQVGSSSGQQRAQAVLLPGPGYRTSTLPRLAQTMVRPRPRVILGAVVHHDAEYLGVDIDTTRVYRIERMVNGEKVSFDSAARTVSVDSVGSSSTGALAGVSVPIPLHTGTPLDGLLHRLTITAGVDPENPRKHQYLGLSVLHFVPGVPETFPLELHLLGHFGKITELRRPDDCRLKVGEDPCETRTHWEHRGFAASLSFDAGTVIADVIKKLAK